MGRILVADDLVSLVRGAGVVINSLREFQGWLHEFCFVRVEMDELYWCWKHHWREAFQVCWTLPGVQVIVSVAGCGSGGIAGCILLGSVVWLPSSSSLHVYPRARCWTSNSPDSVGGVIKKPFEYSIKMCSSFSVAMLLWRGWAAKGRCRIKTERWNTLKKDI